MKFLYCYIKIYCSVLYFESLFCPCMTLENTGLLSYTYIPNNISNYTVSKIAFVNITRKVFNYSEARKSGGYVLSKILIFDWKFEFYHWQQICPWFPLKCQLHCAHLWGEKRSLLNIQVWRNLVFCQSRCFMIRVVGSSNIANNGTNASPWVSYLTLLCSRALYIFLMSSQNIFKNILTVWDLIKLIKMTASSRAFLSTKGFPSPPTQGCDCEEYND